MNHNCSHVQSNSCSHGCCNGDDTSVAPGVTSYICPMHPNVKQDKPGSCPECEMNLISVKKVNN